MNVNEFSALLNQVGEICIKVAQALAPPAPVVPVAATSVNLQLAPWGIVTVDPDPMDVAAEKEAADFKAYQEKKNTPMPASDEEAVALLKSTPVPPSPAADVPVPSPPAADVPVPPPPAPAAEVDSSGLPWDKRIHATTKTKKVDGTWKALRGVDKALIASVTAELRAANPKAPEASQADKNVVFMQLMQKVTGLTTPPAGSTVPKVTIEAITAVAVKHGAANIPALLQGPIETINAVMAEVEALCLTLA